MMSRPTTNCRFNSGFKSSSSTADQGMCRNSIFFAESFVVPRGTGFRLAGFALLRFLAVRSAFAISVHPAFINSNRIVVQVAMRQLQGLRFAHFAF